MSGSAVLEARPALGVAAMLGNTALVPLMAVAIRYLTAMDLSTLQMLAWRSGLLAGLLLPLLALPWIRRALKGADLRAHLVHAAFGLSSMTCFYIALRTMPIATVTAINFTTPILALILARLLFGDRIASASWAAVAVGFAGTLLILRPDAGGLSTEAWVVLLGSALAAGMMLAVRRMPARSSHFAVVFYLSLAGAIAFAAALGGTVALGLQPASTLAVPALPSWPWIAALAATALGIHMLASLAFRLAASMLVGSLDYFRLIWALAIGWLLFAEAPDDIAVLGMALIVGAGLFILIREARARRVPAPV